MKWLKALAVVLLTDWLMSEGGLDQMTARLLACVVLRVPV